MECHKKPHPLLKAAQLGLERGHGLVGLVGGRPQRAALVLQRVAPLSQLPRLLLRCRDARLRVPHGGLAVADRLPCPAQPFTPTMHYKQA